MSIFEGLLSICSHWGTWFRCRPNFGVLVGSDDCHPLLIGELEVERVLQLRVGTCILHNPKNHVRHMLGKRGTGFSVSKQ